MSNINWNNKKEVLKAITQDGHDLSYVSEGLKNDKELVLVAVNQNSSALRFASVYESYRIQIIIDCFSGKIKNVNVHNVSVLIEQMISIYIDFMKTLNGAIKRKSTLYIMTN